MPEQRTGGEVSDHSVAGRLGRLDALIDNRAKAGVDFINKQIAEETKDIRNAVLGSDATDIEKMCTIEHLKFPVSDSVGEAIEGSITHLNEVDDLLRVEGTPIIITRPNTLNRNNEVELNLGLSLGEGLRFQEYQGVPSSDPTYTVAIPMKHLSRSPHAHFTNSGNYQGIRVLMNTVTDEETADRVRGNHSVLAVGEEGVAAYIRVLAREARKSFSDLPEANKMLADAYYIAKTLKYDITNIEVFSEWLDYRRSVLTTRIANATINAALQETMTDDSTDSLHIHDLKRSADDLDVPKKDIGERARELFEDRITVADDKWIKPL